MRILPGHKNFFVPRGPGDDADDSGEHSKNPKPTKSAVSHKPDPTRSVSPHSSANSPPKADAVDGSPVGQTKTTPAPSKTNKAHSSTKSVNATKTSTTVHQATDAPQTVPEKSSTHAVIAVAAAVAAVIALAVVLWFVRKWLLKRRGAKIGGWRSTVHENFDARRDAYPHGFAFVSNEKDTASLRPLMASIDTPVSGSFPTLPPPAGIPETIRPSSVRVAVATSDIVSPVSTTNQAPNAADNTAASPPAAGPTSPFSLPGVRREAAMVMRTFVPTLSDELAVGIGDTVFINEVFDDGWTSCTNASGQCGVVPLECLQSLTRTPRKLEPDQQATGDWRTSKRHSSLYGGVRGSGTY